MRAASLSSLPGTPRTVRSPWRWATSTFWPGRRATVFSKVRVYSSRRSANAGAASRAAAARAVARVRLESMGILFQQGLQGALLVLVDGEQLQAQVGVEAVALHLGPAG